MEDERIASSLSLVERPVSAVETVSQLRDL